MVLQPRVVFLDQNKWIELAKLSLSETNEDQDFLSQLLLAVTGRKIIFPITFTQIYETMKIRDVGRRNVLATVMACLSQGIVYRSRDHFIEAQLKDFFCCLLNKDPKAKAPFWFLSSNFLDSLNGNLKLETRASDLIEVMGPRDSLRSFLAHGAETWALKVYSASSRSLIERITERRKHLQEETVTMQRRAHSALLFMENQELVFSVMEELGLTREILTASNSRVMRNLIEGVPTFEIERELSIKLEREKREINENDLRDFHSYCKVLAVSDIVIGEKAFIGRIEQTQLDRKYRVRLSTKIVDAMN